MKPQSIDQLIGIYYLEHSYWKLPITDYLMKKCGADKITILLRRSVGVFCLFQ